MNDVEKLGDNFHLSILSIISSILCCPVVIHMIKLLGPCMGKDKMELTKSLEFLPFATKLRSSCFYRCLSVHRGGVPGPGGLLPGGCLVRGGLLLGGCLVRGGAWSGGSAPRGGLLLGAAWYPSMH